MLDLLFRCFTEPINIVEVNEDEFPFNDEQVHVHEGLKSAVCVPKLEWYRHELGKTKMGCECGLVLTCVFNLD